MLASPRPLSPALEKRKDEVMQNLVFMAPPPPRHLLLRRPVQPPRGRVSWGTTIFHMLFFWNTTAYHDVHHPVPRRQVQLLAAILRHSGQDLGNPHAVHTAEESLRWRSNPTGKGLENPSHVSHGGEPTLETLGVSVPRKIPTVGRMVVVGSVDRSVNKITRLSRSFPPRVLNREEETTRRLLGTVAVAEAEKVEQTHVVIPLD
ncbi:hypothetical protein BHM03_00038092 [Ensete ventricosum]|nr:hypothetical protein BHM03_00038092 [Ensete ventricosum]